MRRRLALWLTLVFVGVGSLVYAANYVAYEQITIAATPLGFTAALITPAGKPMAQVATCRLETAEIRYTVDGTTPSVTVGTPWEPLEGLTFNGHDTLLRFQAFRTTGVSALLNCVYSTP